MSVQKEVKKITTHVLQETKHNGEKIAMLPGYDFTMAKILDSKLINIETNSFDLSGFENGIYFVKVKTNNQLITKKINLIK